MSTELSERTGVIMDYKEFSRLSKFRRMVLQTGTTIDEEILTATWRNEGEALRGRPGDSLWIKGEPTMFTSGLPATAYELVCFSRNPDGARKLVDWRKYNLVVATGSTYKLADKTLYLCLKKDGTFTGRPRSVLRQAKTAELLVTP